MERSILSTHPKLLLKASGSKKKSAKSSSTFYQDIKLSFDTQRIQKAKSIEPVDAILLNASYTEELSFQPTVPVGLQPLKQREPELLQGDTLANRIARMDFRKSQALMLFSIAAIGLMIGLLISFIL